VPSRRRGRREELSEERVVEELRELMRGLDLWLREPSTPLPRGLLAFRGEPRLPALVYVHPRRASVELVELGDARLLSVEVEGRSAALRLRLGDREVRIGFWSPAQALAHLFHPEVLRAVESASVVEREPGFGAMVEVLLGYGPALAAEERGALEQAAERGLLRGVAVLTRWPGINFDFVGLEYREDVGSPELYLTLRSAELEPVLRFRIRGPEPSWLRVSLERLRPLPAFREVERALRSAAGIAGWYRGAYAAACMGLRAYVA